MEVVDVRKCHWQVILNPNALGGKCYTYWHDIASLLNLHSISFTEHPANHANAGTQITRNLCKQGERYFIVLGGDGTLNEVINGIATANIETKEVFVVPFPVGTGNDWARTHHYPPNWHDIFAPFLKGNFMKHDIGVVSTLQNGYVVDQRYFINIAGFCFDAAVIHETTKRKRKFLASAVYLLALIKVLFTYKAKKTQITTFNETYVADVFTIAVGICKYNGNGMMQVPMADPTDGLFDIVIIRKISPFKVAANVLNLFKGEHIKLKEVSVIRANEVHISSDFLTLGEVEGEMLTNGDYEIKCFKEAVNILAMRNL